MTPEDVKTTRENNLLLALKEHPTWGAFVRMVEADLEGLDSISSLYMEGSSRDELVREIEIRYHTITKIRSYINEAILRAETAIDEEHEKHDIIKYHNQT